MAENNSKCFNGPGSCFLFEEGQVTHLQISLQFPCIILVGGTKDVLFHGTGVISFLPFFFFFLRFRAAPAFYGRSQAKGLIGAATAGLHYRHSNARSKPCL